MTKSEYAIERTLAHEGGFVDHPFDPGGATNYGISLRWYREEVNSEADVNTIKNLTKDAAIALYQQHFWCKTYDLILDRDVAAKIFDMDVNMGRKQAHRLAQRACQACGEDIKDDGVIGERTLHAINHIDPAILLPALRATQAGFYRGLVMQKVRNEAFLKGWLRRAYA